MPREFPRARRVEEQLKRLLSELVRREGPYAAMYTTWERHVGPRPGSAEAAPDPP